MYMDVYSGFHILISYTLFIISITMLRIFNLITGIIFVLLLFSSYSFALCIAAPEANLRKGPGTKFEKTWAVFKYMPLQKMSQKGNWYKVKDLDGDVHWVYKKLVTDKFKCAAVTKGAVNIRSGPGIKYDKTYLSPTMRYDTFRVIQTKGSWVNVADALGNSGWIFKKLLWIQ